MKLLNGEQLPTKKENKFSVPITSDLEEEYANGEFRIVTEQGRTQLPELATSLVNSDKYNLSPSYQRKVVWSQEKKSRLIESFLMNIPIPPVFLYETEYARYEVMDGQQRMATIREFYNNDLVLSGLEVWAPLNGMRYRDLPNRIRSGIDRRYLSSIILLTESARTKNAATDLKLEVFARLNTGGMQLTAQELRYAKVEEGPLRLEIEEIVKVSTGFHKLWGIEGLINSGFEVPSLGSSNLTSTEDNLVNRKLAEEHVLRFFANRQRNLIKHGTFKELLDKYWVLGNGNLTEPIVREIGEIFIQTCNLIYEVFGMDALYYWKLEEGKYVRTGRRSVAVYDAMTAAFSSLLKNADDIRSAKERILETYQKEFVKNRDMFDGRKTDYKFYKARVDLIRQLVSECI
ncbi:DUF262 domain-containing protein [Corynebacterium sp. MSK035]|uniref:DUF262 domain-containing protein n=1 Tax=Corynebacterium TaxID=1716 RepID=UPI0012466A7D|nr:MULTISPECIES: DUF262 domain-containing protein [Corynebacterium]KAA9226404.1 DUF262 domain-containing protein [Corynebacterium amycolatum]MDK8811143.1 DUF262 domain-containing protein [Corynebacterium sp. MSK035]